jgi:hypothetical protein
MVEIQGIITSDFSVRLSPSFNNWYSRVEDAQDAPLSRRRERLHSRAPPPSKRYASHSSSGTPPHPRVRTPLSIPDHEIPVDAIFSGHSDGLLLILRATL